jgi:hypothetical protein
MTFLDGLERVLDFITLDDLFQPPSPPRQATRDLYVSVAGDDANAGTVDAPFRTIQQAALAATPGTVVHVAPGLYQEEVKTDVDGTAEAPITYISDVDGGAVIRPVEADEPVWTNSGDYTTIQGFEIDGTDSPVARVGILAHGNHVYVQDNEVHHILQSGADDSRGGGGIVMDGSFYNEVDQNVIGNEVHHIGAQDSTRVHGIYHQSTGSVVDNVVYSNPLAGISTWHDPHDLVIARNIVIGNGAGIVIGAGDHYQAPAPADNIRVETNVVLFNDTIGIGESGSTGTHNSYVDNVVYGNSTDWSLQNGLAPTFSDWSSLFFSI